MATRGFLFVILSSIGALNVFGQAPVSLFDGPTSACLNEQVVLSNQSQNANGYIWDFCHEDLKSTPSLTTLTTLPTATAHFYHSVKVVQSQGLWYGIITDMNGQKIYRAEFGASLDNTPTITQIGGLSFMTSPAAVDMVQIGVTWYALVTNISQNNIIRITFGNGLNANPTLTENLGNFGSNLSGPSGLEIINYLNNFYVMVTNQGGHYITVINYGSSILNTPISTHRVGQSSIINSPYGTSFVQSNGNAYLLTGSFSTNKVFILNFGINLLGTPVITEVVTGINASLEIETAIEGGEVISLVRSHTTGLYRINFNNDLSSAVVTNLSLSTPTSRAIALVRTAPDWRAFTVDASAGVFKRLVFTGNCLSKVSANYSSLENPVDVFYKQPAQYTIELVASAGEQSSVLSKNITVQNLTASGVQINTDGNACAIAPTQFFASSASTITDYSWDFGDGSPVSTQSIPSHLYSSSGDFTATLRAIEQNGCANYASKTFALYNQPVAGFDLPSSADPICSMQPYDFINQTVIDAMAPITWQWKVDNTTVGTTKDLKQTFAAVKTYAIELEVSIPGCSNSISKNFDVLGAGTAVDFAFSGQCLGSPTDFTSTTSGIILEYEWDFGDGQTSAQTSVAHQFLTNGVFKYRWLRAIPMGAPIQ